ncbi:MAG: sugar phosphate isomerase/epimerase family protein [Planctomycetota bacterium]
MGEGTTRRRVLGDGVVAAVGAVALGALGSRAARAAEPSREPGQAGIHLGLVTYLIGAKMDLPTLIKTCEQTQMEGVELRSTHAHGVEPHIDDAARQKVKERFAKTKVKLVGLGSACEYHSPNPKVVKKNIEQTKAFVDLAADLGAWGVKVRPNGLPKGVPEDKTLRQIAGALRTCGDYARDKGIVLFTECHGRGTSDPARMAQIMKYCDHSSVCLCWNCNGVDIDRKTGSIQANFDRCKPWIRHVHIHDLYAGYPYRELFGLLKDMKFAGYTMIEMGGTRDPVRVLRYYRALWETMAL